MLELGEELAGMPIRWTARTAATALLLMAARASSLPLARAQNQPCTP